MKEDYIGVILGLVFLSFLVIGFIQTYIKPLIIKFFKFLHWKNLLKFFQTLLHSIKIFVKLLIDNFIFYISNILIWIKKLYYSKMLSNIEGKSLDNQQRNVVVSNSKSTLVIAGAGSGKTLTIVGKVKYLCKAKKINPADILLLSFTNKATNELTERIKRSDISINATTFHKLGLHIYSRTNNGYVSVCDDQKISQFVSLFFEKFVLTKPELIRKILEYFAYYCDFSPSLSENKSLGELYEYEKGKDFESLKSKYEYIEKITKEKSRKKESLLGEQLKSREEVKIANFLFLNGIQYEYEKPYPFETEIKVKKYTPDFYLPDYDLYIEHFGIDENGNLPWLSNKEEIEYKKGMEWKKRIHKKNGTTLLETYSYYDKKDELQSKLEKLLLENGVKFKKIDFREIYNKIYIKQSDKYFNEFKKLCVSFINLFKSNDFAIEDIKTLSYKSNRLHSVYSNNRANVFKSIITPLIEAYETYLNENNYVDFSDMINKSAKYVKNGEPIHKYKYIIVDEYQDISMARYKLIKAIQEKTKAKILCVGDDWQSIFKFAGSDVSLFINFKKCFCNSRVMKLENTYRNSQQLIDAVGNFITKNPKQIQKSLRSAKKLYKPLVFWCYQDSIDVVLKRIIDRIIDEFGVEKSILFLGRTKYDKSILEDCDLFEFKNNTIKYKYSPNTPITFLSVHKAKGLEADNVVLLNFKNDILGFPNKISDDPILELVMSNSDDYEYAEERRLLYVALTRTKNRSYVLVDKKHPSEFLKEFEKFENVQMEPLKNEKIVKCPRCKTGNLMIRHNKQTNNNFVGCSNYPRCNYINSDVSMLEEPKNV